MEPGARELFEHRFGQDFSDVRVHADAESARFAQSVGADAFTIGRDVVFGSGRYAPQAPEGQRLLAHELAHVVQQQRGGATPALAGEPVLEQAADRAATSFIGGSAAVPVDGASAVGLARQPSAVSKFGEDDLSLRKAVYERMAGKALTDDEVREWDQKMRRNQGQPGATAQAGPGTTPKVDGVALIAERGTSMEASYRMTHFQSDAEVHDFIDRYIAYTKDKPNLQRQYQEALAARPRILAERAAARQQTQNEEARKKKEQEDAVAIKKQDDADFEKSQRVTVLGALLPDSTKPYYKDPSREVKNPVYKMQAETSTGAQFGGARLARDTTAVVSGVVGTVMLVAEGALALDAVVMIGLEAAAASQAATPIMSLIVGNPIAASELALFGAETVLSIVIAGGVKSYLDSLATPEGAINMGLRIVLHVNAFSTSGGGGGGGTPRQATARGNVVSVKGDKASIRITAPPHIEEAAAPPATGAGAKPPVAAAAQKPTVSQQAPSLGGRAANDNDVPDNVVPLRRPQAAPVAVASGQDFSAPQHAADPNAGSSSANDATRAAAAKSGGKGTPVQPGTTSSSGATTKQGAGAPKAVQPAPPAPAARGTNNTIPGTMGEAELRQAIRTEPGLFLYRIVDARGNHLKWGVSKDPYKRFDGYVNKEGQRTAQMIVYRPHPRFQSLGHESEGIEGEVRSGGGGQNDLGKRGGSNTRSEMRDGEEWGEVTQPPSDPGAPLATIRRW
jgi:hypothetical protein